MFFILRKLRKSLIGESSLRRYLLYAVGEILLVMIGILLALQVNNWNEQRKDTEFENRILNQIYKSVLSDLAHFEMLIGRMDRKAASLNYILDQIQQKQTPLLGDFIEKSANYQFSLSLSYDKGAYETLKSAGLEKIRNDSLRFMLIRYYEVSLPRTANFLNEIEQRFEPQSEELYDELTDQGLIETNFVLEDSSWTVGFKPNLALLLSSPDFKKQIRIEMSAERGYRNRLEVLISRTEGMINVVWGGGGGEGGGGGGGGHTYLFK